MLAPFSVGQSAPHAAANDAKKPLRLGLIIGIGKEPDAAMAKVRDLGLPRSQVFVDDFEMDLVGKLRQALEKHQIVRQRRWLSEGPAKKFGTSINGRSRLVWSRAAHAPGDDGFQMLRMVIGRSCDHHGIYFFRGCHLLEGLGTNEDLRSINR